MHKRQGGKAAGQAGQREGHAPPAKGRAWVAALLLNLAVVSPFVPAGPERTGDGARGVDAQCWGGLSLDQGWVSNVRTPIRL